MKSLYNILIKKNYDEIPFNQKEAKKKDLIIYNSVFD